MGQFKKKLSSDTGASIIIALLFFLICATVGAVVLAMANANVSHIKTERINEKNMLSAMSAGSLIKTRAVNSTVSKNLSNDELGWETSSHKDDPADDAEKIAFREKMETAGGTYFSSSTDKDILKQKLLDMELIAFERCWQDNDWNSSVTLDSLKQKSGIIIFSAPDENMQKIGCEIIFSVDRLNGISSEEHGIHGILTVELGPYNEDKKTFTKLLKMTMGTTLQYTLTEDEEPKTETETDNSTDPPTSTTKTVYYYSYTADLSVQNETPVFSKP